jgi:hypothetical protein
MPCHIRIKPQKHDQQFILMQAQWVHPQEVNLLQRIDIELSRDQTTFLEDQLLAESRVFYVSIFD